MPTTTQKKTAEAIVNIFETGEVLGDYSQVTLLKGDSGHLTYGRSQTTLGSGNLYGLLKSYCENPGARFRGRLEPTLSRFATRDLSLDNDYKIQNVLRAAADDPVMRDTQDAFFEESYWLRAVGAAERLGIVSPLGVTVVYDGFIHGSWGTIRDRTTAQVGKVAEAGERKWISEYVSIRRAWLAGHSKEILRHTVYRMDAFQRLIDQGYWGLDLPLVVRDKEISVASLTAMPKKCYDGPQPGARILSLQAPLLRGLDVRLVQLGLSNAGSDISADGIFGQTSVRRLKEYQTAQGLPVTGVADMAVIARLTA